MLSNKNACLFYVVPLLFIGLFILEILFKTGFLVEAILAITAIIILWYTRETSEIRRSEKIIAEANKEIIKKYYRPIVNFCLFTNTENPFDIRFNLLNQSEYATAVQVKCTFKFKGEKIKDIWPEYDGKQYWNLQYKEEKEGHFSIFDLYFKSGLLSKEKIKELKLLIPEDAMRKMNSDLIAEYNLSDPPELSMDLELFCSNDLGFSSYYPPIHYDYDHFRRIWVPTLTSDKPYWEYNSKPSWVNSYFKEN